MAIHSLSELEEALKATGYPVAYSHFEGKTRPPYITYALVSADNFAADDVVYSSAKNVAVELYVNKKDGEAEQTIEQVLDGMGVYYEKTKLYIDSEALFEVIYEIII